jgi:hypothetical protein
MRVASGRIFAVLVVTLIVSAILTYVVQYPGINLRTSLAAGRTWHEPSYLALLLAIASIESGLIALVAVVIVRPRDWRELTLTIFAAAAVRMTYYYLSMIEWVIEPTVVERLIDAAPFAGVVLGLSAVGWLYQKVRF